MKKKEYKFVYWNYLYYGALFLVVFSMLLFLLSFWLGGFDMRMFVLLFALPIVVIICGRNNVFTKIILSKEGVRVRGLFGKNVGRMTWDEIQSVGVIWANHLPGVPYSMVYFSKRKVTDENFDEIFNDNEKSEFLQDYIKMKRTRKLLMALDAVYDGEIEDRDVVGLGDMKEK